MSDTQENFPLPPANFTFLVESIMMQTQLQLGIFTMGDTDEAPEPNLPIAAHSIELLVTLQEKTRGNLTPEEVRTLENGLTELRYQFVQVQDEVKRTQQSEPVSPVADKPLIITAGGGKGTRTE